MQGTPPLNPANSPRVAALRRSRRMGLTFVARSMPCSSAPWRLPLLPLLLLLVSAVGQGSSEAGGRPDEGASTLAFVFDVTGSMYDDWVQVIEGASRILETSLSRPEKTLHNFALVPFHDPDVGPASITTDPERFQKDLRDLYVQGGGDCPEMSVGAVRLALEVSLPGSFIYVFTDARAKDYRLTADVLQLIQHKQSQVVFVLTGDCGDQSHPGYRSYEEIASTSSGQVFHLDKKQVNEVLKWVEEAVQASKVHLLSTDHEETGHRSWTVPFDPSLREVTVSLSGAAPEVELWDPSGKQIKPETGLSELLHLPNSALIVSVKLPTPGLWTIKITSSGRHSVRVTGLSTIDFHAGFSRTATDDYSRTERRPVLGLPTHMLLNVTGLRMPGRAERVELLTPCGRPLKGLPVAPAATAPWGIWRVAQFVSPSEKFFVRVSGVDRAGFSFQRYSSVAFSNIVPDLPRVRMAEWTAAFYLQAVAITCTVESLIPYTLRFTRNGAPLGRESFLKESGSASWEIGEATARDEGHYECVAVSQAGAGHAATYLQITEPAPEVRALGNVTVAPGETATLSCRVGGEDVSYNVTWTRHVAHRGTPPRSVDALALLGGRGRSPSPESGAGKRATLQIRDVRRGDAGRYDCTASNRGGASTASVWLHFDDLPRAAVSPPSQTFVAGAEVRVACRAAGHPAPAVTWAHGDADVVDSARRSVLSDGTLLIRAAARLDAGSYTCTARNRAGTHSQTAVLTYTELPSVVPVSAEVLVARGASARLECRATGSPAPRFTWHRGGTELRAGPRVEVDGDGGALTLHAVGDEDAGDYTCRASNPAGSSSGSCRLTLGVAPRVAPSPAVVSVAEGQQLSLPCVVLAAHPLPRREWFKDGRRLVSDGRVTVRTDGSVHVQGATARDAGRYSCLATNLAGTANKTVTVNVWVAPRITTSGDSVSAIEGVALTLACAAQGQPPPVVTWAKGREPIFPHDSGYHVVAEGLRLPAPTARDSDVYTCTASSPAGTATAQVHLTVYVKPRLHGGGGGGEGGEDIESRRKALSGEDVVLPCNAESFPPPTFAWNKDGHPVGTGLSSRQTILESGSLQISRAKSSDSGVYACIASNVAGNVTREFHLTVLVPPRIQRIPTALKVRAGHMTDVPCTALGEPSPSVSWVRADGSDVVVAAMPGSSPGSASARLLIPRTRAEDAGSYRCVAVSVAGRDQADLHLQVLEPPSIVESADGSVQHSVINERVTLSCTATGVPPPVVKWLHDGAEVTGLEPGVILGDDGALVLPSAALAHAGRYACLAVNEAGIAERAVQLLVAVPPLILASDRVTNVSIVVLHPVTLECDASGFPAPVLTWHRAAVPLVAGVGVQLLNGGRLLRLSSVAQEDSGSYTCRADNAAGTAERVYYLHVLVPPSVTGAGEVTEVAVDVSGKISLECQAAGNPPPSMHWYKDGKIVASGDPRVAVAGPSGETLRIHGARLSDQGLYVCTAVNSAGRNGREFSLTVHVAPSIRGGDNGTGEVTVLLNGAATMDCDVLGVPAPSVTWLKDGHSIVAGSGRVTTPARGRQLQVSGAQPSDAGRYTCRAKNPAGEAERSYTLHVHAAPRIEEGAREHRVLAGGSLALDCHADGRPPPRVAWLRDGSSLGPGSPLGPGRPPGGSRLSLSDVSPADAGEYACVATNAAGESTRLYTLKVLVPPKMTGNSTPTERSVILNAPLTLECPVSGNPTPDIRWLKDGEPAGLGDAAVRVSAGGRTLQVARAQASHAGRFACVARNEAGESSAEFRVAVQVPPSARVLGQAERAVLLGRQLTLQCTTSGLPPPLVAWLKDGRPLSPGRGHVKLEAGNRTLQVLRVLPEDGGRYACVATNSAGESQHGLRVQVHEPPSIESGGEEERKDSVVLNQPLSLECVASGNPPPALTWYKDGQPLTPMAGVEVTPGGRELRVESAQLSDGGRYACRAASVAGVAERAFRVRVMVPPSVTGGSPPLLTALVNEAVRLECDAHGDPTPGVTWLKDGSPLASVSGRVQVLSEGRVLALVAAGLSDGGRYVCVALNEAGEDRRSVELRVYVPPNIVGEEQNVSVVLGRPLRLECRSEAVPPPTVTWLRDGRPLLAAAGVELSQADSVLQIGSARIQDTAWYTCEASNVAGKTRRNFNVEVFVPPLIRGPEGSGHVTSTEGATVSLVCEASGIPPPMLTWAKDGVRVLENEGRVRLVSGGRVLLISSSVRADSGAYSCEASNTAGRDHKAFSLQVHVPPTMPGSGGRPTEVVTLRGRDISLECDVSGEPTPSVAWSKDGRPILSPPSGSGPNSAGAAGPSAPRSGSRALALEEGRVLRLRGVQISDTGRYACVARNVAGQAEKKIDLIVQVPPTIPGEAGAVEKVAAVVDGAVSLTCEASGFPPPAIAWRREGRPLAHGGNARILSGGRVLRLSRVSESDGGDYSCVASNPAGEEGRRFHLEVLVPPRIQQHSDTGDVKVKEHGNVTLACEATGNPLPSISWLKDGHPIMASDRIHVTSMGQSLTVLSIGIMDGGKYTCMASNLAGDAGKDFYLHVLVMPSIAGGDRAGSGGAGGPGGAAEEVSVVVSNPTALVCEAHAVPPPVLTWLKDGAPLQLSDNMRMLPGGRTLQIVSTREIDSGVYTCVATNEAGEILKHYQLQVFIPPVIRKADGALLGSGSLELKLRVNSSLALECDTLALPPPTIAWYHDGQPLESDERVDIAEGGRSLRIARTRLADAGRYTCVASNAYGQDDLDFLVSVQVPPSLQRWYEWSEAQEEGPTLVWEGGPETRTVVQDGQLSLPCETNAVPPPTLTWLKDGRPLAPTARLMIHPGGHMLQIMMVKAEDSGRYTCVAVNEAGEDSIHYDLHVLIWPTIAGGSGGLPVDVTVTVNGSARLECVPDGVPPPSLSWLRDSRPLPRSGGRTLTELTSLQIHPVQVGDAGRYSCVAENSVGRAEKLFNLNVHLPPFVEGPNPAQVGVVVNNSASLVCNASGFPPPTLAWLKDGVPVQPSRAIFIAPAPWTISHGIMDGQLPEDQILGTPAIGGRVLQIPRVKLSDSGRFTCVASNAAGRHEKDTRLSVHVPPSIRNSGGAGGPAPAVTSVRAGQPLALECAAEASPPPLVAWFHNGRRVGDSEGVVLRKDGQLLQVARAQVSHSGHYVCKVSNVAGEVDQGFIVSVNVPPSIEGPPEESVTEVLGNPTILGCDAAGVPHPAVSWQRNGFSIGSTNSLERQVLSGGSRLQISRVHVSDAGVYSCVATNSEGEARKRYTLAVLVPPRISGSELPSDVNVVVGEDVPLRCSASGQPSPAVRWLHDGRPLAGAAGSRIRISKDDAVLTIASVEISDSGKYTCVATNAAGEEERIYTLHVHVPPVVEGVLDQPLEVLAPLDGPVSLECMSTGSPLPQLSWLKDGLPLPLSAHAMLLSAGQVLRIARVQASDSGTYTCVASNRAGITQREFTLRVQVPPLLEGAGDTEELQVLAGASVTLACEATGSPPPMLTWLHEGRQLYPPGGGGVVSALARPETSAFPSEEGLLVQIANASPADAGVYSCVAVNAAGQTSKHFLLTVQEPPVIEGLEEEEEARELSVLLGGSLELTCVAAGSPPPSLTWLKDGRPLPHAQGLTVLPGGQTLRIASATAEHGGRYTCLASSPAGDTEKEFLVQVHVPPNIAGSVELQDVSVTRGGQVSLECRSDASPPPTLAWLKDDEPLQASPRVRILASGRYVQISGADTEDAGRYVCVASNVAGSSSRTFTLAVLVSPSVVGGPGEVSVHLGGAAVLPCTAVGSPPPTLSWRKDGALLSDDNARFTLLPDGSLEVVSVRASDAGTYTCVASNAAGSDRVTVMLTVLVPPGIARGPTNVTALVGGQATLSCEASGLPKPAVSWKKNGRPFGVDRLQITHRLLSTGSLHFASADPEDTAQYECTAANEVGEERITIDFTVLVPPSIADEADDLVVTDGSPVLLTCHASGAPEPSVHWSKDGARLPNAGDGFAVLSTGTVEVSAATPSHAGRYTCTARNAAGTAHRHVSLTVQGPPIVTVPPSAVEATLHSRTTLSCEASGRPQPTLSWQREGVDVVSGGRFLVQPGGSLHISQVALSDGGTYVCVAQNAAGTVLAKVKLLVHVPPAMRPSAREPVVVSGAVAILPCAAEGSPAPELAWLGPDGRSVQRDGARHRVLSNGSLQVGPARPSDAGRYTCTASNAAGTASVDVLLTVHTPPSIRGAAGSSGGGGAGVSLVVTEGSRTVLPCSADGSPSPKLSWRRDGDVLRERPGKFTILQAGDLILDDVQVGDGGEYACVATSVAGSDARATRLVVHAPPAFTERPGDVSVGRGERLTLTCAATGIPAPTLTWSFNNRGLPARVDKERGVSEVTIERATKDDSGTYVCTAENEVASIRAIGFVYVKEAPVFRGDLHPSMVEAMGGNAILDCEARGDPPPSIHWSRMGGAMPGSNRVRQLHNGSLAIYGTVSEDSGDYKCVATNDAGAVERMVTLTIQRAPSFVVEPRDEVVEAGGRVSLPCRADGRPRPAVEWTRDGRPLPAGDPRVSVLPDGTLAVDAARPSDAGRYECVAHNLLGSALTGATVSVRVHGGYSAWQDWGPCTATCGDGVRERVRSCANPAPANGGRRCEGPASETQPCHHAVPCPVDGRWRAWAEWGDCSPGCGHGERERSRTCSSPAPQHGGRPCSGLAVEVAPCFTRPCPVDGGWATWGYWSTCTTSCGRGTRRRQRTCSAPAPKHGGSLCAGSDSVVEPCNEDSCPVHGAWSPWGEWDECSRTCGGGGTAQRRRSCDSPSPAHGGRACAGPDTQARRCATEHCPVDGSWGAWQGWDECSASCGRGKRSRVRECDAPPPAHHGLPCAGEVLQVSECNPRPCLDYPPHVRGSLIGQVNDVEFGVAQLLANATTDESSGTRIVEASISNVPPAIGPALRVLVSVLSSVYWTSAFGNEGARNGFQLTGGAFRRDSQLAFSTGETLRLTHVSRGLDADGTLLFDLVLNGYIPLLASYDHLCPSEFSEEYIQTGPGKIFSYSAGWPEGSAIVSQDAAAPGGDSDAESGVTCAWNHTTAFEPTLGLMTSPAQTLRVSAMDSRYDATRQRLTFSLQATFGEAGESTDGCPRGFLFDSEGPYCGDVDECALAPPCSHLCQNAVGTFSCTCPRGYIVAPDDHTCVDVDECVAGTHMCHLGQDCENSAGSYRCVVRCGPGFTRTPDGTRCRDVNECEELAEAPCQQRCLNVLGSFRCACLPGFLMSGHKCVEVGECRGGRCASNPLCKAARGGTLCLSPSSCPAGTLRDHNGTCQDVDECREGTHRCAYNQVCENTHGGHRCSCPRGYRSQGSRSPCADIDECHQAPRPCMHQCRNSPGSFHCVCPPGQHLLPDGRSCSGKNGGGGGSNGVGGIVDVPAAVLTVRQDRGDVVQLQNAGQLLALLGYGTGGGSVRSVSTRTVAEQCPEGYREYGTSCLDVDECREADRCQHECRNSPGSFSCLCPGGYRLATNGRTCQDVDECSEQNVKCGPSRMCFNIRGGYQCVDTPCPSGYQKDSSSSHCVRSCPSTSDLECTFVPFVLEYKLVSLPAGVPAGTDLIRLSAFTRAGRPHTRTSFYSMEHEATSPFGVREERASVVSGIFGSANGAGGGSNGGGRAIIFARKALQDNRIYRLKVRALSFSETGKVDHQTTFVVIISVAAFPY